LVKLWGLKTLLSSHIPANNSLLNPRITLSLNLWGYRLKYCFSGNPEYPQSTPLVFASRFHAICFFMLWNSISNVLKNTEIIEMWIKRIWNFWCLAPLSAIFQLYRGDPCIPKT
jgi:hypothetical protein